jgi:hypothetical protein
LLAARREHRYISVLAVDPDKPERWYVSAASGPREAHGGGFSHSAIYFWEVSGTVATGSRTARLVPYALATLARGVLFAGLADGTLLRSDDRAESWDELHARPIRSSPSRR